jgi:hypothetical protein
MSYKDAINLLDRRREGAIIPVYLIDIALRVTGDLDD